MNNKSNDMKSIEEKAKSIANKFNIPSEKSISLKNLIKADSKKDNPEDNGT